MGISSLQEKFSEKGWDTMGTYAFASGYIPGVTDDSKLVEDVFEKIFDSPEDRPKMRPPVRRLFFEAFTLSAAEMKRRVERSDEDMPRKVPNIEREARKEALEKRLVGLQLDGELECSDSLIDLCIDIWDVNQLRYIEWQHCTKKLDESRGIKKLKEWKPDANGVVHERSRNVPTTVHIGAGDRELGLKVDYLLKRRAAAMEIGGILTFETHEQWRQILMETYMEAPPPHHDAPGLSQLVRADQELFHVLNKMCRKGIRASPDGTLPLDLCMAKAMEHRRVKLMLNPLPSARGGGGRAQSRSRSRSRPQQRGAGRPGKNVRAKEEPTQREQALRAKAIEEVFKPNKPHKGKGKGKGEKPRGSRVPQELMGHNTSTPNGPLCYGFNLSSCSGAEPGGKCSKGLHLCARKGCVDQKHSFSKCPRQYD